MLKVRKTFLIDADAIGALLKYVAAEKARAMQEGRAARTVDTMGEIISAGIRSELKRRKSEQSGA